MWVGGGIGINIININIDTTTSIWILRERGESEIGSDSRRESVRIGDFKQDSCGSDMANIRSKPATAGHPPRGAFPVLLLCAEALPKFYPSLISDYA